MLLYQADIAGLIPDMLISGPLDLRFEYQAPLIFVYKNMGNHSVKECAARSYTTWCLHSQTCARLRARTRTNTNPNDTEANAAGRSVRACVARKSKS